MFGSLTAQWSFRLRWSYRMHTGDGDVGDRRCEFSLHIRVSGFFFHIALTQSASFFDGRTVENSMFTHTHDHQYHETIRILINRVH